MFFCDPCRIPRGWPEALFKSYGPCEVCNKGAVCNDVPSRYLPMPSKPRPTEEKVIEGGEVA